MEHFVGCKVCSFSTQPIFNRAGDVVAFTYFLRTSYGFFKCQYGFCGEI
jgi:hypothetical protein